MEQPTDLVRIQPKALYLSVKGIHSPFALWQSEMKRPLSSGTGLSHQCTHINQTSEQKTRIKQFNFGNQIIFAVLYCGIFMRGKECVPHCDVNVEIMDVRHIREKSWLP